MPAAELRPVERSDFERLHPLLEQFDNNTLSRADWRRMLFEQRWKKAEDAFGFALWDKNRIVGYIGNLYSYPLVRGTPQRFCNLSSWIVESAYRSQTLTLLRKALLDTSVTYTALTCIRSSAAIFQRMGFRLLEDRIRIFHPLSAWPKHFWRKIEYSTTPDDFANRLGPPSQKILKSHLHTPASHLFFENRLGHCYLLLSRCRLRRFDVMHVHHISHPHVFWHSLGDVQHLILRVYRAGFWMTDERHVGLRQSEWGISHVLSFPRLFRPADALRVNPRDIEATFSELMYLQPGKS